MTPGRPSSTALLIARSTVVLARDPRFGALVPPQASNWCERFLRDHLALAPLRLGLYRGAAYRRLAVALESLTLPGIQLHYAVRKRWIEAAVREALDDACGALRVIGAGFDTLALRLADAYPSKRFVEIDHPDTQAAKRHSIERRSATPANLDFRALDLAAPNAAGDGIVAADPGDGTVVVAEGVLMYLDEADVQDFFRRLRRGLEAPVRVVFTHMAPDGAGRIRFHNSSRFVDRWLDFHGEPFRWGIDPSELEAFLGAAGFRLRRSLGHEELRERFLAEPGLAEAPLARGERIAVAETA